MRISHMAGICAAAGGGAGGTGKMSSYFRRSKRSAVCIKTKSKNKEKFLKVVGEVVLLTKKPLILVSVDPGTLKSAADMYKENKPVIHAATAGNIDFFIAI